MTEHDRQPEGSRTFTFRKRHRLRHAREFDAVFSAKCCKHQGPLTIHALPNGLGESRLGLSVGKRVGNAVRRSQAKRAIREVFRLSRHLWPIGLDIVVVVRPHTRLTLAEYQRLYHKAIRQVLREWQRRGTFLEPEQPELPTSDSQVDSE
ncbi:MAG: ribonuclease P protein component [Planctomycetes bacterium]|nr:ribonuclease P protein component [Planctomycetota bacterium]